MCVSVLPERFRPFEDRSYAEILRHIRRSGRLPAPRLLRTDDTLDELRRRLDTVVRQIKRLAALNRPFTCPTGPWRRTRSDGRHRCSTVSDQGHRFRVVGLSTAIKLRQAGADVTVVSSDRSPMASAAACALWLPLWVCSRAPPREAGRARAAGEESWHHYRQLLDEMGDQIGMRSIVNHEYLERGTETSRLALPTVAAFRVRGLRTGVARADVRPHLEVRVLRHRHEPLHVVAAAVGRGRRRDLPVRAVRDLERAWTVGSGRSSTAAAGRAQLANDRSVVPVRGQLVFRDESPTPQLQVSVGLGDLLIRARRRRHRSSSSEEDDDAVPPRPAEDERKLRSSSSPRA